MIITHLCLCGPYTDCLTYQENLLTKYHSVNGNIVNIITSKWVWNSNGKLEIENKENYVNNDKVHIYRLNIKNNHKFSYKFKKFERLYETLKVLNSDILFIHGVNFVDINTVIKYLKKNNKTVKVYIDNHADYSNSASNWFSRNILHKIIWKHYAKKIEPYTDKFYGVLPARVDFLTNLYKLPKEKTELLLMGADDEYINKYCTKKKYYEIRKKYNISENDFVIVTGGKIDAAKFQTIDFMKAVNKINNSSIKLYVFGSIDDNLKQEFDNQCNNNVKYLGWANKENAYEWFNMADLVVFPGRHSVYWEQVVAIGKPMICKYWEGTNHIDIGGNVIFFYEDKEEVYISILEKIVKNDKNIYEKLKEYAQKKEKNNFLYSEIAKKAIGDVKND